MSFSSGIGSFPGAPAPAYGTPVYPSTLTAQEWNPFNGPNRQQPGPGEVSTGVSINTQHAGSWKSEVPVEGQLRLIPGAGEWTRYIEAGDQFFAMLSWQKKQSLVSQRNQMVAGFNMYTMNAWLRDFHTKAFTKLQDDRIFATQFFQMPEHMAAEAITKKIEGLGSMSTQSESLLYLTIPTIMKTITYMGVNNTQSNELKSLDSRNGSISAKHGEPMVVFGGRGPHRMRNLWGKNAQPGRHLWLILKRHAPYAERVSAPDRDSSQGDEWLRSVSRPFQFVAYCANKIDANIPDSERMYDGAGVIDKDMSYRERGRAFYVGLVLSTGRVTQADNQPLTIAQGLATLNAAKTAQENNPPTKEASYDHTQALEYITVQVNPQAFGSFVNLA